jgi:hypothetical protein
LLLAFIGPFIPSYHSHTGLEVTPQEWNTQLEKWSSNPIPHYRLQASYGYHFGYCYEDVEIQNETIVRIFHADCSGAQPFTLTELFAVFSPFVGEGEERPITATGCSYFYVDALFDPEWGYPTSLETVTILNVSKRESYLDWKRSFSCLTIGSPHYYAEVEQVTILP